MRSSSDAPPPPGCCPASWTAAALVRSFSSTAALVSHYLFLKIWSHFDGRQSVDCYANGGKADFGGWWVDRISTGNNDLIYYDANGDSMKIERWHDITFPNRPPKVVAIQIV